VRRHAGESSVRQVESFRRARESDECDRRQFVREDLASDWAIELRLQKPTGGGRLLFALGNRWTAGV
jgi:hypothetical protein